MRSVAVLVGLGIGVVPASVGGAEADNFGDTYTIIERTVTESHGRHGRQFDTTTSTLRVLTGSTLISSTCEPISVD